MTSKDLQSLIFEKKFGSFNFGQMGQNQAWN